MALFHRLNMPLAEEAPESITKPFGPRSAGDELRQRREELGLDLAEVAATLRIKPAYLAALEAGCPNELPGAVYAIGFIRAYADHLGLDSGEMLRLFKQQSALFAAKPDLAFPIQLGERSLPGGMLLVGLILAVCGYGGWFYLSTGDGPRPERVAQIPLELLPYREAFRAPPPVSQPMVEAQAAPRSPAVPSEGSEHSGSGGRPSATGSALAAVPAATDPAPNSPGEVVIRANADSWIQIRDARQSVLLTRVLKAGESCRAPDRPGLSMRTGNAGGLEITVNGVPAPPIGGRGMVRRNVALDGHALLAGSAVRN
jgi:cytoskeleton protein RodZ